MVQGVPDNPPPEMTIVVESTIGAPLPYPVIVYVVSELIAPVTTELVEPESVPIEGEIENDEQLLPFQESVTLDPEVTLYEEEVNELSEQEVCVFPALVVRGRICVAYVVPPELRATARK
jgi:hypothetical protein